MERRLFIKELKNKYHKSFDLEATLAVGASIGHAAEQSVLPEGVSLQQHLSALQKDSIKRELWDARQKDEDVTQIPGHSQGEVGIRDNFVDAYMGKVYPYNRNFEILSMGVEAVFHGHDGGLVGMNNSAKSDIEMRDFVLGTFATVGLEGNVDNLSSESALDW